MNPKVFNRLLYRTVIIPLALLAILATALLWEVHHLRTAMQWVDHTDQVISSGQLLLRFAIDAETGVRGYLITGNDQFLDPYNSAQKNISAKLKELDQLVSDDPAQRLRLKQIQRTLDEWQRYAVTEMQIRREGGDYADITLNLRGKQLMDSVRQQREEFIEAEEGLRSERVRAAAWASRLVTATCVVLSLGIGLFLAIFTRRQIRSLGAQFHEALGEAEDRATALERSERRWVTTLTSIGDAVIATDVQGNVTFMNDLAQRLSGWNLSDAKGRPSDDVFRVMNESDGEAIENPITRAIRLNRVVELANHALLLGKNGERIPVEDSAAPIIDAEHAMVGTVLVFRDVTEKRRRERERAQSLFNEQVARKLAEDAATKLRRIQAVTDAALSHAAEQELLNQLLARTCDALQADIAVILLLDEPSQFLRVHAALGLEEELQQKVQIPYGKGMAGTVASTGRRRIINDLSKVEVASAILRERVKSLIAVPLVAGNKTIGVMHADSVSSRQFTEEEAELLQVVADRVALAIDRMKREEALERVGRTLKALNNSNQALLRATDEIELLQSVCRIVTEDCGHPMVWIGYVENDENKTVRPVAHAGFETGYLESLQVTWANTERGRGPTGIAVRTGQPAMCADMLTDPAFAPWREEAIKRGYGSSLVIPLLEDGKVFGTLTIYSRQPHGFAPEEIKLLQELAGDLSYGIGSLRARALHAQAVEALLESEQRWATTLSSIGDAVISTDAAGKIVFMNDVAQRLTAWTMSEARGESLDSVFEIVNEVTRAKPESPVAKALRMNQVVGLANHTVLLRRDGSEIPIDDSAAPIRGRNGEIDGVVLVFRDVSERKKAEELLRNSERLAITGRMAASIAHEIHNPLDAVGNLLYVIQNEADVETAKKYAAMAGEELNRVVQMTKHMLAFNREVKTRTPLRIPEIMATVMELYARKIQVAGIAVEQRIEFTDEMEAYPSELRQVLANLVGNAIQAVEPYGKIVVHAYASHDWKSCRPGLRVTVADNGHGIAKGIREKIFDPFFTTKGDAGTGLGLWITSGLVEKHGGILRVRTSTREGKSGTCFSAFFPFEAVEEEEVKNKAASQA